MTDNFHQIGEVADSINVKLSFRIIQLFSEGLYASPNKAIEELVVNSFDAGALNVHIVTSDDFNQPDSTIAVIDDGTGMDIEGLQQHWIVGLSAKRNPAYEPPRGRRPIGKFGIGKLASYVLGDRLTHISKIDSRYFSTSMDYSQLPDDPLGFVAPTPSLGPDVASENVQLAVRELTDAEAQQALSEWIQPHEELHDHLFGPNASDSWTAAVISSLKPMAADIRLGRLRYILSTAMPLRDDFRLCLNGTDVPPYRIEQDRIGKWTLGKDLVDLPRPAPTDFEVRRAGGTSEEALDHHGLSNSELGRVYGYVEVYRDPIDTGKSAQLVGRSNGFFVYALGRLLNVDDSGFGIDRNQLRHGTFSRLRVVIHVDSLDRQLRSSRESVREGETLTQTRHLLQGLFNFARSQLAEDEEKHDPEMQLIRRLQASPVSLTERPIVLGVHFAMLNDLQLTTVQYPTGLDDEECEAFVQGLHEQLERGESLICKAVLEDLTKEHPIAQLDISTGKLTINTLHPFVANFIDEFIDAKRNLPLELLAASEVILELSLLRSGLTSSELEDVMADRDLLLRELARSRGPRTAFAVAQELLDSVHDKNALEDAVVNAFESLGYHAVPRGGKNNPDGIAEAPLPVSHGVPRGYRLSLEAKSKERSGTRVNKSSVGVSTVARHRDANNCDWAVVVGPDFSTTLGDNSAVMKEIARDFQLSNGTKGITLVKAENLARLVRHAPARRLTLSDLRDWFATCRSPDDSDQWISAVLDRELPNHQYREILDSIWKEQSEDPGETVSYGALRSAVRHDHDIRLAEVELQDIAKALTRMAPEQVYANDSYVELHIRPDVVLATISSYISEVQET